MTTYDLGDGVNLEHEVRNRDDQLTDASVVLTLTAPDGTATTPAVTHAATGVYQVTVVPDATGPWIYRWQVTGAVTDVAYGNFTVSDPAPAPDMLATYDDLMRMPGVPADLTRDQGEMLIQAATSVVQAAAGGQRILQVVDDTVTIYGGFDRILTLPQRPVTAVTSVTFDGTLLTQGTAGGTWRRAAAGIWRDCGWASRCGPVATEVVYTHGWPDGHHMLGLARTATLGLAKGVAMNPTGITRMAIDDYQEAYDKASAALEASTSLAGNLRRQYGRPAGSVRIT